MIWLSLSPFFTEDQQPSGVSPCLSHISDHINKCSLCIYIWAACGSTQIGEGDLANSSTSLNIFLYLFTMMNAVSSLPVLLACWL